MLNSKDKKNKSVEKKKDDENITSKRSGITGHSAGSMTDAAFFDQSDDLTSPGLKKGRKLVRCLSPDCGTMVNVPDYVSGRVWCSTHAKNGDIATYC